MLHFVSELRGSLKRTKEEADNRVERRLPRGGGYEAAVAGRMHVRRGLSRRDDHVATISGRMHVRCLSERRRRQPDDDGSPNNARISMLPPWIWLTVVNRSNLFSDCVGFAETIGLSPSAEDYHLLSGGNSRGSRRGT